MLAEQPNHHPAGYAPGRYGSGEASFSPVAGDQFGHAPLFQRLEPGSDHFADIQELQRHVDAWRLRASDFERMNADLEQRLQKQGNQRMQLEAALTDARRQHDRAIEEKQGEIDELHKRVKQLTSANRRVREQYQRAEHELLGVLAKKYEMVETAKREARKQVAEEEAIKRDLSRRRQRIDGAGAAEDPSQQASSGPRVLMRMATGAPKEIRTRLAADSLDAFFGC